MRHLAIAATMVTLAAPAFAESHGMTAPTGDAAAGEKAFRQCVACHVVKDAEGETLAGRNARTGPNLYGIAGGPAGTQEDFKYSKSLKALGEEGAIWDEEAFVGYVQDPTGWLRDTLDDKKARGKMSFKVRKEEDARDLFAYLHSLAPAE